MNRKQSTGDLLRQLPTKWAVALVVAVIAYAFVQPVVNNRLGWNLPSVASLSGQDDGPANRADTEREANAGRNGDKDRESASDVRNTDDHAANSTKQSRKSGDSTSNSQAVPDSGVKSNARKSGGGNSTRGPPGSSKDNGTASKSQGSNLRYGLLKSLGNEVYLSPAGLRYTRGSEEGHRLKHVEKHLSDQPSRPGSHGVFDGDMPQVLRWIDEAYELAERGAKGTSKRKDRGRVVMEAPFSRPIGFVGGQTGKRKGNP
ncbi:MAG: hypothetical protein AAGG44_14300, partial [Planctomycetota bacterium]